MRYARPSTNAHLPTVNCPAGEKAGTNMPNTLLPTPFPQAVKWSISRNREDLAHWREVEGRETDNKLPYQAQGIEEKMNQLVRHSQ